MPRNLQVKLEILTTKIFKRIFHTCMHSVYYEIYNTKIFIVTVSKIFHIFCFKTSHILEKMYIIIHISFISGEIF